MPKITRKDYEEIQDSRHKRLDPIVAHLLKFSLENGLLVSDVPHVNALGRNEVNELYRELSVAFLHEDRFNIGKIQDLVHEMLSEALKVMRAKFERDGVDRAPSGTDESVGKLTIARDERCADVLSETLDKILEAEVLLSDKKYLSAVTREIIENVMKNVLETHYGHLIEWFAMSVGHHTDNALEKLFGKDQRELSLEDIHKILIADSEDAAGVGETQEMTKPEKK